MHTNWGTYALNGSTIPRRKPWNVHRAGAAGARKSVRTAVTPDDWESYSVGMRNNTLDDYELRLLASWF